MRWASSDDDDDGDDDGDGDMVVTLEVRWCTTPKQTSEEKFDEGLDHFESSDALRDPLLDTEAGFPRYPHGNKLFGDTTAPSPLPAKVHTLALSVLMAVKQQGGIRPPQVSVKGGGQAGRQPVFPATVVVSKQKAPRVSVQSEDNDPPNQDEPPVRQQGFAERSRRRSHKERSKRSPSPSSSGSSYSAESLVSSTVSSGRRVTFQQFDYPLVPDARDINPYTRAPGLQAVLPCFFKKKAFDGYNQLAAKKFVSEASLCEVEVLVSALSFLFDWQEWAAALALGVERTNPALYSFIQRGVKGVCAKGGCERSA